MRTFQATYLDREGRRKTAEKWTVELRDPDGRVLSVRLRLTIDLVPLPIAYMSLSEAAKPAEWRRIRQETIEAARGRCGVCGASARLHCHETWQYLDDIGVARLKGFESLCSLCHAVRHLAPERLGHEGEPIDIVPALEHFCRVNGCSPAFCDRYVTKAWWLWGCRNQRRWRVDLGCWARLVPSHMRRGRFLRPVIRERLAEKERRRRVGIALVNRGSRPPKRKHGAEKRKGKRT